MVFSILQFEIPSWSVWTLAWIFLILGVLTLIVLVVYTRFGREISIKLSIIFITSTAIFLGFGIHFFLISFGI
jgi:hypothetical protein